MTAKYLVKKKKEKKEIISSFLWVLIVSTQRVARDKF